MHGNGAERNYSLMFVFKMISSSDISHLHAYMSLTQICNKPNALTRSYKNIMHCLYLRKKLKCTGTQNKLYLKIFILSSLISILLKYRYKKRNV